MLDETTFDELHEQIARETYAQAHAAVQNLQAELAAATTPYEPGDRGALCLQELDSAAAALASAGLKPLHARLRGELQRLNGSLNHHYESTRRVRDALAAKAARSAELSVKLAGRVDDEVIARLNDLIERIQNKTLD